MNPADPRIWLAIDDFALRRRCLALLKKQNACLARSAEEADLIVSDLPRAASEPFAQDASRPGWLVIGDDPAADAALPRNFLAREWRTVLQLAAQIVFLRRASEHERKALHELAHRDP